MNIECQQIQTVVVSNDFIQQNKKSIASKLFCKILLIKNVYLFIVIDLVFWAQHSETNETKLLYNIKLPQHCMYYCTFAKEIRRAVERTTLGLVISKLHK